MRITIDVEEKLWKEIMKRITDKYGTPYGKYRKIVINEILRMGLKKFEEEKTNTFKRIIKNTKVSSEFLSFLGNVSREIRKRAKARK